NFKAEGSETLEQIFNRLQVILSHLEFMDIEIEQDDLNQKFLTSPPPEWLMHMIVWRNRSDLNTMSLDYLYNHLKVYESEVQKKSESNCQIMAFISLAKHNSGDEEVNTASVSTASTNVSTVSANIKVDSISEDTACAYIASQSSGSQIKFENINQIDEDDIKEMDIKWNMALLSMRADRFWKKIGKNISIQGTDVAGFDKSKVECFNCHKMGHFAKECRAPRSQDRGRKDNYIQGSKVKEQTPKDLMAIDEVGWDWSYMANDEENHALVADEEAPTEFSLMAKTSAESEVFANSLCSKSCNKNTDSLNSKITDLDDKLCDAKNMIYHYKLGLTQVKARLAEHRNQEVKYCEKIRIIKFKTESRANCVERLIKKFELIKKEKEGYSVVPPPPAQVYSPPKKDLSWTGLPKFADDTVTDYSRPAPTIESSLDDAQNRNPFVTATEASPSTITPKPFIKFIKATDSGCSRHMTGNISYLSDYEPFNGGYVSFGQGGCKFTGKRTIKTGKLESENLYFVNDLKYNLFSVSQICDNKNIVLFTDSECIVLGRNFKLSNDANVLLKTPRQHNMYSIDLNNIVPHKDLTCLVAKASVDKCMLWHRRLGHLNFKTMNKLVRYNLVRGLPTQCFENDHTCTACLKGKQHKASCKSKLVNSVTKPIHTLHMDLFGPTSRNMSDLDTMSLDYLYNHLKVYESEVQKKSESNCQIMAFISLAKHNSGNEEVNTASTNVSTVSANIKVASIIEDTACAYIASQSSGSQIKFENINQINEDDIKEMDIKWNMALLSMRADRAPRSQDRGRKDNYIQGSKVEEQTPKDLMAIDEVGWDWSYMANDEENHALVADEEAPTEFALMAKTSAESEDLDSLLEIQRLDKNKEGLRYSVVPPPPAQVYSPPKKDLSWTGLPKFADDTITDYSRPAPTIESSLDDAQNKNPFVTATEASPSTITPKPFIKFVKATDRSTKIKTAKDETTKPAVKYAVMHSKPSKSSNVRGNQRN
nr:putative ribonuclease H-like domain-containing protein [Tanacetum cinerariifolium]